MLSIIKEENEHLKTKIKELLDQIHKLDKDPSKEQKEF